MKKEKKRKVTKKATAAKKTRVVKKKPSLKAAKKNIKKPKKAKKIVKKAKAKTTSKKVAKAKPAKKIAKKVAKTKPTKKTAKKVVKKTSKPKNKAKQSKKVTKKVTKNNKKITKKSVVNKEAELSNEQVAIQNESSTKEPANNKKTALLTAIIVVLALLLFATVFMLFRSGAVELYKESNVESDAIRALPKEADPIYKETWQEFHDKAYVPDDYVGQIIFESGIINEPVLQGDTNETYIMRNYETYKYEVCGPVFMDYICDVETDQNLILYGHNRSTPVDPEHVMMFSPLHVLENEENYDKNKLIYIAYEDRLDIYLVASVYPVKIVEKDDGYQYLVQGEPLYYLNNYSPDQFDTYLKTVKQKQFYDTGVKLVNTDELLTLQTCYEDKLDKLIVLAKKIGSVNYKED